MILADQIEEVLMLNKAGFHLDDIAKQIISIYPNTKLDMTGLSSKVGAYLSLNVKKKGSIFARVAGKKKGSYRRGIYRLRRTSTKSKLPSFPEQPKVSSQYTGCAGEHAVISELLFWGFNASIMTVDDGIDIVASRNSDYFHIQVKTSNTSLSGDVYSFSIDRKRQQQKHSSSTFYVLALRRRIDNKRYSNDYVILPSFEIKSMIAKGVINDSQNISMRISVEKGMFLLNGTNVTHLVNNFDIIT